MLKSDVERKRAGGSRTGDISLFVVTEGRGDPLSVPQIQVGEVGIEWALAGRILLFFFVSPLPTACSACRPPEGMLTLCVTAFAPKTSTTREHPLPSANSGASAGHQDSRLVA